MILVQPEQGAAQQKAADFVAAIVEDAALPVRVIAFARVSVLVEKRAIETGQAVAVGGEMGRHPIQ